MHEPIFLKNNESDAVVVFIHGFMGSPRQFDALARSVRHQGFSAASLLLPGHASTVKDFSSSTMEKWQDYVNAEIGRLSLSFRRVFLVGHSMGCLLAINAANKHGEIVNGLFLIACPLVLSVFSARSLRIWLKQVFRRKTHPIKSAYVAGSSVPLKPSLIWRFSKPFAELKRLILVTRDSLCNVRVPVTAVFSPSDEIVSMESLDDLRAGLTQAPFDYIALSDSSHAYFPEHERSLIESSLLTAVASLA